MREWLTVIIILLIIGIILDGVRRVRAARRERIHLSASLADESGGLDEDIGGSEFPSGGARVAGYRHPDETPISKDDSKEPVLSRAKGAFSSKASLDAAVESAPVLMDSAQESNLEPALGNIDELDGVSVEPPAAHIDDVQESRSEPKPSLAAKVVKKVAQKVEPKIRSTDENSAGSGSPEGETLAPEEVIVINVMAQSGYQFHGADLLAVLTEQNLRFGTMDIFHRHKNDDGSGEIFFSLANIVKPGTFDLNAMNEFGTPGVSMFMTLPIKGDSVAAFGLMARTAKAIAEELQGELKDENRSVMTQQTFEHCRQRVIEFERKRRLAR